MTPLKVAGRTQVSNEAAQDSRPEVANQIGLGLARDIARKIDAAFFANTPTNTPSGLLSLSGINVVDTGCRDRPRSTRSTTRRPLPSPMALS